MAASNLILSIGEIPEEGLNLAGELPMSVYGLKDGLARAKSPLRYDLQVSRADQFVILLGSLAVDFSLTCVHTSKPFDHQVRLDPYQESVEMENPEFIDLTERIREDTLLALPAYPSAPDSEASFPASDPEQHRGLEKDADGSSAWDALDGLQNQ
jgi:uncharacterized metal-binding protein YceD (DUF177 family)